jgi:hypothetical protein
MSRVFEKMIVGNCVSGGKGFRSINKKKRLFPRAQAVSRTQDSIRAFSAFFVIVVGSHYSLGSPSLLTTPSNSPRLPSSRCFLAAAITAPSASASSDALSRALAAATRVSGALIALGSASEANHRLAPVARAARTGAGSGDPATGVESLAAIRHASATSRPRPSCARPAYSASARKGKTIGPTAYGGTEARMGRVKESQPGNETAWRA